MVGISMISSPMEGSCGIGTYASDLADNLRNEAGTSVNHVILDISNQSPIDIPHYFKKGIVSGLTNQDVIHHHHEYGHYGKYWFLMWPFYLSLFMISRLRKKPVVITIHEAWYTERLDPPFQELKGAYVKAINSLIVATADRVVFPSRNTKQKFEKSVPVPEAEIVPHGVNIRGKVDIAKQEAKTSFGYDADDVLIVEPGYVRESKGYETFLAIAETLPEYSFLVAGGPRSDGKYYDTLQAKAPDNISFTGLLSDERFHTVFNAADIVVLPYQQVAQSGIFNWCAVYELPTVASDLKYFQRRSEIYNAPVVFDRNDPKQAAELIENIIRNDKFYDRIVGGMRQYQQEYSFENVANRYTELYADVDS